MIVQLFLLRDRKPRCFGSVLTATSQIAQCWGIVDPLYHPLAVHSRQDQVPPAPCQVYQEDISDDTGRKQTPRGCCWSSQLDFKGVLNQELGSSIPKLVGQGVTGPPNSSLTSSFNPLLIWG
eukprot:TRINITY_DN3354_c0_g3_i13.p2 TRINITY_DN3354_c0_g3~~TRINITY_DN3354_c0_g3_i13.p2  ORF type:complete len:122 (+),score=6.26 TRINITY_DN3354_c0_g3_i13:278-643(+)